MGSKTSKNSSDGLGAEGKKKTQRKISTKTSKSEPQKSKEETKEKPKLPAESNEKSSKPPADSLPAVPVDPPVKSSEPQNPFQEPLDSIREEERPMRQLAEETHFDLSTLRKLNEIFNEISSSQISDGFIDASELTTAMGLNPTCLLARGIFRIFDVKQTKAIDFPTWAKALSALSSLANIEEKIRFSFSLFDINNDGSIDVNELRQLLEAAVRENGLNLTDAEVQELCQHSLSHVDRDGNGTVEYSEYKEMVKDSIKFLESFTLDIDQLCDSFYSKSKKNRRVEIDEDEAKRKAEAFKSLKQKKMSRSSVEELGKNEKKSNEQTE